MTKRRLGNNTEFSVPEKRGRFVIRELVGEGASCYVYRADFIDEYGNQTEHLLKEYAPKGISYERSLHGELQLLKEEDWDSFSDGMKRFVYGYKRQLEIRKMEGTKNTTTNIQDIYYANGTCYIDMPLFNGEVYSKVTEKTFHSAFRRMLALTKIIQQYHEAGYLHLDIKPGNIFAIPETCEMLFLFDFDSVRRKEEVRNGKGMLFSENWAAPEQVNKKFDAICEATDLYAIGEILFVQLVGRHSYPEERRSFSDYEFEYRDELCDNINPIVFRKLSEVFRKTLCRQPEKRVQSAEELSALLEELIQLSDSTKPFLKGNTPAADPIFVGREVQLQDIKKHLEETNILVLRGIGGIGKSELAKKYAQDNRELYDVIVFAQYTGNLDETFERVAEETLYGMEQQEGENESTYIKRRIKKWKELISERTLLIVDNMDNPDEAKIDLLSGLGCSVLITSRVDLSEEYCQMSIVPIENQETLLRLFSLHYGKELHENERDVVLQLIQYVDSHTMMIKLLALQMKSSEISASKMLRLMREKLTDLGEETFKVKKDNKIIREKAFGHVKSLFQIAHLTKEQKIVLVMLSVICTSRTLKRFFVCVSDLRNRTVINELVELGWIQEDLSTGFIEIHRLIKNLSLELLEEYEQECKKLLGRITSVNNRSYVFTNGRGESMRINERLLFRMYEVIATNLLHARGKSRYIVDYYEEVFRQSKTKKISPFVAKEIATVIAENMRNENVGSEETFVNSCCIFGGTLLAKGYHDAAVGVLEEALHVCERLTSGVEKQKNYLMVAERIGLAYTEIGQYDKAEKCLEDRIIAYCDGYKMEDVLYQYIFLRLCETYYRLDESMGRVCDVLQRLRAYVNCDAFEERWSGTLETGMEYVGMYFVKRCEYTMAEKAFQTALDLLGKEFDSRYCAPRLYGKLSYIYNLLGEYEKEEASIVKGIKESNRPPEVYYDEDGNITDMENYGDFEDARASAYIYCLAYNYYCKHGLLDKAEESRKNYEESISMKEVEIEGMCEFAIDKEKTREQIEDYWRVAVEPNCNYIAGKWLPYWFWEEE